MSVEIDCVGEICPIPVVKAKIQYKKLIIGDSITVITDHSCTSQEIRENFSKYNCSIAVQEDGGIWYITITRLS